MQSEVMRLRTEAHQARVVAIVSRDPVLALRLIQIASDCERQAGRIEAGITKPH